MNVPFTFSFAVGSEHGPRSWKWTLTIDNEDLYITASVARKCWKVTLHRSGRWHVKSLKNHGEKPIIRLHARDADPDIRGGLAIVIPDACLRRASDVDNATKVDHWFPRPPYDGFVEIVVGGWNLERDGAEQPLDNRGFDLMFYRTAEQSGVFVGYRSVSPTCAAGVMYAGELEELRKELPKPVVLDSPERRGVMFSESVLGLIRALEFAVD